MLLLTFTAGANHRYAVVVARVVEVVPRVELRPVPHAPVFLAGLLGYRGKVVPVIDVSVLLGAPPCPERLSTRIILVNAASGDHNQRKPDRHGSAEDSGSTPSNPAPDRDILGLIAEHVSDLITVRPEQVSPPAVQLPEAPYLGAIVQTVEGIVQLIEVEKLRDATLGAAVTGHEVAFKL
jgi:chemotaxis-related protein WspB